MGDIDLDGDLDIVTVASVTLSAGAIQVLVNQGGDQGGTLGEFADDAANSIDTNGLNDGILDSIAVLLCDVTGDGFPELILGGDDFSDPNGASNRPNWMFINDGAGNFVADPSFPTGTLETQSVACADLNGDGFAEVILGNGTDRDFPEDVEVLVNDANSPGRFTLDTSFPSLPGEWDDVVPIDVDGVNGCDLFLVADGQNRLLLNDGSGGFTDVTATNLPVLDDNSTEGPAGDMDNDGDIDIAYSIHTLTGVEPASSMLLNQGGIQAGSEGTFVKHSTYDSVPLATVGNAIAAGDVDNDGDTDLFIGNAGDFGMPPFEDDIPLINRGCGTINP